MISALERNHPSLAAAIAERWNNSGYTPEAIRYFCFGIALTLIKYDGEASDDAFELYDLCRSRESLD